MVNQNPNSANQAAEQLVTPGSIGGRIKRVRNLYGLTQNELGLECGFTDSTADVRIAQYEKNRKAPKQEALNQIADALNIDPEFFHDGDMSIVGNAYHTLFDLEDFMMLHPVKIDGKIYLEFGGESYHRSHIYSDINHEEFLNCWFELFEKYKESPLDNEAENRLKWGEYSISRSRFLKESFLGIPGTLQEKSELARLQSEMDVLFARMNSEHTLKSVRNATKEYVFEAFQTYCYLANSAQFMPMMREIVNSGLRIIMDPTEPPRVDPTYYQLFSIRVDDILGRGELNKELFGRIECAMNGLKHSGVDIKEGITSKDKELFYCFKVLYKHIKVFESFIQVFRTEYLHDPDFSSPEFENRIKKASEQMMSYELYDPVKGTHSILFSETEI